MAPKSLSFIRRRYEEGRATAAYLFTLTTFSTIGYVINEMAKEYGHKVIRLPLHHCHLNSIELIWTQIKKNVARSNKKFNITKITKLTVEASKRLRKATGRKLYITPVK